MFQSGELYGSGGLGILMASKLKIYNALIKISKKSDPSFGFEMPRKISTEREANHFFVGIMLDCMVKASVAWSSAKLFSP